MVLQSVTAGECRGPQGQALISRLPCLLLPADTQNAPGQGIILYPAAGPVGRPEGAESGPTARHTDPYAMFQPCKHNIDVNADPNWEVAS